VGWVPGIDIHLCWEVISFSCRKPFTTAADFCEGNKYFDMCFFDADTPLIGYLESNLPFVKGKTPRLSLFTIIIPKPFCSLCIESNTSLQYTHGNELAGKRLPTQGAYKTEVHPSFEQQSITPHLGMQVKSPKPLSWKRVSEQLFCRTSNLDILGMY
jgi:hypothetical protein